MTEPTRDPGSAWRDGWKLEVPGHAELLTPHLALRAEIKRRYNRALPFGEELFDRWERAAFLDFGRNASIYDSSVVIGEVTVGEETWIGPFTVLDGSGGLSIGSFCSISAGVHIYSHDTVKWALTRGHAAYEHASARIEDCCYIGPLSVVSGGVTIGEHSVVGAHSFVRESVPPFSIAVGSPARVVGRVELVGADDVRYVYDETARVPRPRRRRPRP